MTVRPWVSPNRCSACYANHPGPCGCWCHQPAASAGIAPACHCPDHPDAVLQPLPGGGARCTCPVDSRSYQMAPLEVTA